MTSRVLIVAALMALALTSPEGRGEQLDPTTILPQGNYILVLAVPYSNLAPAIHTGTISWQDDRTGFIFAETPKEQNEGLEVSFRVRDMGSNMLELRGASTDHQHLGDHILIGTVQLMSPGARRLRSCVLLSILHLSSEVDAGAVTVSGTWALQATE